MDSPTLTPLHFQVSADRGRANKIVAALREAACGMNFASVGPAYQLLGDECAVEENDPLVTLKVRSRGLFAEGGVIASYMPDVIDGFESVMRNGNKLAFMLASFPEEIEIAPGMVIRPGPEAQCKTFAHTVKLDQDNTMQCVESHRSALSLLREASELGCSVSIQDPYKHWYSPLRISIERAVSRAKGAGARFAACTH